LSKFNYILFDLDGTLIDTTPLILESFRYTIKEYCGETKCDDDLIKYMGIPLRSSFKDMYPGKEDMLVSAYREFNENKHDYYCGVFIGINPVLDRLVRKGITLGVVTSKRRELALRGIRIFNLEKYISVLVGLEDTEKHKPDAEPILKALELLPPADRNTVLYVGDSPYDILCAKNAGVKSAAVRWSYIPEAELLKSKPDYYLDYPCDLLSL
jgi:pyrophosphatase PpaX